MRASQVSRIALLWTTLLASASLLAGPGMPNFTERVYGDGVAWGTKGTTVLPIPTSTTARPSMRCT